MNVRRFASVSGALVVAGIAALASYSHMRSVALAYGQPELIADLLPVSVDGMMAVATVALGDGRRHRFSAWLAFWIGVTASVLANVLAAEPSAIARCISAWPAIAFGRLRRDGRRSPRLALRAGRSRRPENLRRNCERKIPRSARPKLRDDWASQRPDCGRSTGLEVPRVQRHSTTWVTAPPGSAAAPTQPGGSPFGALSRRAAVFALSQGASHEESRVARTS